MLEQIVKLINDSIKLSKPDVSTYGISEMIPIVNDDATFFYPNIVNEFGECMPMSLDNLESMQIYYRLINKSSATDTKSNYGSSNKNQIDTYLLSMYVSCNRRKTKLNQSSLSLIISKLMPDVIQENGKQIALIYQTNCDFNSQQIINSEFPNTDYAGMPDIFMFRQEFQIRHTNKKCLEVCETDCKNYSTN